MIKVNTTRFGEIEILESDCLQLATGLIGFSSLKNYVLIDHDDNSPFKWLQSLEDGGVAFVLVNPLLFKADYIVEVSESEISDLCFVSEEDAVVSVIITMPSDPLKMTANLRAPVIFNLKNRKGKQVILSNAAYLAKHNIIEEMKQQNIDNKKNTRRVSVGQK